MPQPGPLAVKSGGRFWFDGMCVLGYPDKLIMKIAITAENGQVFQHFGRTPEFAVFEVVDGKVASESLISSGGSGHGALAGILAENGVETLICGGIGAGAVNALSSFGISVIGGASGDVRKVAEDFACGRLATDPDFACGHHHHEGGCGGHDCHCG